MRRQYAGKGHTGGGHSYSAAYPAILEGLRKAFAN
jgi:hypothetical protein